MGTRYVLVDFNHMAHRYYNAAQHLSSVVNINGTPTEIDTTIANYTSKAIYRYGNKGEYFVAVCHEGGCPFRKEHFNPSENGGEGYKDGRAKLSNGMKDSMNIAIKLMQQGGVSQYCCQGYEADDMIYTLVNRIKQRDEKTPIDIITNDADLLPLVDNQVSVYIRGTREFAMQGCPSRKLYYQVTPVTWEHYLSGTSAYKNYYIPYNSMLLFKLIRGDKADNIAPATKGYGGKKYSDLMYKMESDGVDFPNIFRYGNNFDETMRPVLSKYFTTEEVDKMAWIYEGLNLRNFDGGIAPIKQMAIEKMQPVYLTAGINIY